MTSDECREGEPGNAESRERRIAEIVGRCSDRINAGESVDIEAVLRENPDLASELRDDLVALLAMRPDLRALTRVPVSAAPGEAGALAEESALGFLMDRTGGTSSVLLRDPQDEVSPVVVPGSPELPGETQMLGGYEVFGEIGRGGIGVVLKGRDRDLGRDVALKLLLGSHEENPQMVRRFIEEAQIGSQLQHPGIVPVYRLGVFRQRRPFFAMKLVKGRTLAALLAERRDPSQDRRRFLGIFEQACQTLAYSHARGVIHRDLKPSNVMVGSFGEVQVMDWGLAKVLANGGVADERRAKRALEEKTEIHTVRSGTPGSESQDGLVLGTPAYMAPEQARGEIEDLDERSDVFGLGAILCEILTGKPPFPASTGEGSARKARSGDIEEAFARLDGCGADAEILAIAKSCLAPARTDRAPDAGAVAKEVTAYLASVEERARKAELSAAEARVRAAEERKRRRATVSLAATVVLSLVLGGGTWIWLKAERDAWQARATRDASDALTQASALCERAKAAGLGEIKLWSQAREQAQRAAALAVSGPVDPSLAEKVRRFLADLAIEERQRQFLAALDAAWMADVEAHPKEMNRSFYSPQKSIPLIRDAFNAMGIGVGEGDASEAAARIEGWPKEVREPAIAALDRWIWVATYRGPEEPSLPWLKEVVAAADSDPWRQAVRAAAGDADAGRRRAAIEKLAETADVVRQPVMEIAVLANQLVDASNNEGAARIMTRAALKHPEDFWIQEFLGCILVFNLKRPDESIRYLAAALAARPDRPVAHLNLAAGLDSSGRHGEALEIYRNALELFLEVAMVHYRFGEFLQRQGKPDEAAAEFRKAIELDPGNSKAHGNLGNVLREQQKRDEAIAEFRAAMELDPGNPKAHGNLGNVLREQQKLDEAIAEFRAAMELSPALALQDPLGKLFAEEGKAMAGKKDFRGAVLLLEKALDIPGTSRRLLRMLEGYRRAALPDLVSYRSIDSAIEREAIVPAGAEWRFFRGKEEPSSGLGWTWIGFEDSDWEKGPSGLGFGDGENATVLADMKGSYTTVYLRRDFDVPDPSRWKGFVLSVAVDGGLVAYLDGVEAGRIRAKEGALPFDAVASKSAPQPLSPEDVPIDPRLVRPGKNVLAIQGLSSATDGSSFSLVPVLLGEPVPDLERDRKRFQPSRGRAAGEGGKNLVDYLEGTLLERSGKLRETAAKFAGVADRDRTRPEPFLHLVSCLRALGDYAAAEARAREAIDAGVRENGELWDLWFAVSAVDLKRSPEEVLASLPKGSGERDPHRADLKWALEELKAKGAIRIRCGGDAYVDSKKDVWGPDRFFASGNRSLNWGKIQGTADEPLYRTVRWFPADSLHLPGYRVPLPPGRYRVTLHFAETLFLEAGKRRFGVRLEGQDVLKDFEAISDGFRTASQKSFEVAVPDGFLDIEFVRVLQHPMISAYEVERAD